MPHSGMPDSPTTWTSATDAFEQLLSDERGAIAQFIELLGLEQASLQRGCTDDLLELSEKKEKLAVHLSDVSAQRCSFLDAQGFTTDRKGVEAWCAKHPEASKAGDTWSAILSLAAEARELQRVNGELIALHLRHTARALEALKGGRKSLELYGPDGQSTKSSDQRINHAV